ncbi:MAG: thiamine pyrophosphate-binding protein [Gallintestinimicrobium sp.]
MNGAQAMVKCLENEGVEMVFGYPGVAICPFYDSLLDTDIKSVLIRTEQNAAHAASGLARVTGKVGVCAVTSGPGATNLITGIATAFADSIPLVCITGQVNSELIGSDVFRRRISLERRNRLSNTAIWSKMQRTFRKFLKKRFILQIPAEKVLS